MFTPIDFSNVIKTAWQQYDPSRKVRYVVDISAMVSTNHVFRVKFEDEGFVIAKCSYFGKSEHFKEDHTIINTLSNKLAPPFENFLAKSLMKDDEVYMYQFKQDVLDAWVVFYNPITIDQKLPRKLEEKHIRKMGNQLAKFHRACADAAPLLPQSSKSLESDVLDLLAILETRQGRFEHRGHINDIIKQCDAFLANIGKLDYKSFPAIPVFIDWNIGNFSVTEKMDFFSRWDYDWFRMSSRMMDFYFFSRVSSSIGDRTVFSYLLDPLLEDRFLWFLEEYHKEYPLTRNEVLFLKEAYRFFILNYVIKYGSYFFHQFYSTRLQREAYEIYFPVLDSTFNADKILKTLKL